MKMKKILDEYLEIVIYTICGIILIFSSYLIIINIKHATYIDRIVSVSMMDNDLLTYKENVIKLESNLESNKNISLNKVLMLLKNDGLYKKMPGDKLNYQDLYSLNNYFIDVIINEGYFSNLKINENISDIYDKYVSVLIYNSKYINRELENNSNFHYDVLNNEIRDSMNEVYQMILHNYKEFSYILLEMCDSL